MEHLALTASRLDAALVAVEEFRIRLQARGNRHFEHGVASKDDPRPAKRRLNGSDCMAPPV
jgi:hypothetical protein